MNVISVEHLTKKFSDNVLLNDLTFGLSAGEKVALVGRNGCGKSTLLRIIAGIESPDSGQVVLRDGVKLAFLTQQPNFNPDDTILEAAMDSDDPLMQVVKAYQEALLKTAINPEDTEMLLDASARMDAHNAWNLEAEVREVLGKLGLHDMGLKVSELSGGMRKRIGLAQALLRHPDVLLLDEPTNHLDVEAIEWLERYLSQSQISLVMVTHDRYFLENVTSIIVELHDGQLAKYEGNYSFFLEKKSEREENQRVQKERARNLMRKELEWIRRQPKARGTKAKYRIDAFEDLKEKATASQATRDVKLDVHQRRQGGNILELKGIAKSYDGVSVLPSFSYTFKKGERIGLAGKNGSGKTTFLNLITHRVEADQGEIKPGVNTHFGYYEQQEPHFTSGRKVIDIVQEHAEVIALSDGSSVSASQLLQRFDFNPKKQYEIVDKLSGGEKRRLQLLMTLLLNPNFLILDEPTNDLDIYTLQVLEDFLFNFAGCLLLVSHDRYFMDRLVDHLFVFEKGKEVSHFNGKYTDFRAFKQAEEQQAEKAPVEKAAKVRSDKKSGLSFKEKRELEGLEGTLEEMENEKKVLMDKLNSGDLPHDELMTISRQLEKLIAKTEEKELRWLELSEKAE